MRFSVLGGDQRVAQLCRLLAEDGHDVTAFALERAEARPHVRTAASLQEAVQGADCVVLPLPVARQRGLLNTPLSAGEYPLEEVLGAIPPESLVCAGMADRETLALAKERGLTIHDYFLREELAVKNAVATAEGAIGLLMQETPVTVCGSRILVLGFGRIGKLLAHRLQGMGAKVTATARRFADLAWIEAMGYEALDTQDLGGHLGSFDAVINTIPAPVLGETQLRTLQKGALCLDLASKPGGVDFAAASRLGVRAVWALSLPGQVAPVSAGVTLRDTIYNIWEERNGKA